MLDCGAALLSRQFDRDRDRMLGRARSDGVCAVVAWCPDIDKLDELEALADANTGFVYFAAGAHPDNISKTSKAKHDGWLAKVEAAARRAECVAVVSGLNLTRDMGTHFAQTSMLEASCQLADRVELPLLLHIASDGDSLDRVLDVLHGQGWAGAEPRPHRRVILHNALAAAAGDPARLAAAVEAGLFCSVSAASVTSPDAEERAKALALLDSLPLDRLLLCSDSPWHTPQNHPDEYVRSARNEPSTLPFVARALASEMHTEATIVTATRANAVIAFALSGEKKKEPKRDGKDGGENGEEEEEGEEGEEEDEEEEEEGDEEDGAEREAAAEPVAAPAKKKEDVAAAAGASSASNASGPKKKEEKKKPAAATAATAAAVDDGMDGTPLPESMILAATGAGSLRPSVLSEEEVRALAATRGTGGVFGCLRCRAELFTPEFVVSHQLAAPLSATGAALQEGLCSAAVFLVLDADADANEGTVPGLRLAGGNVVCASCNNKLGRYASGQSPCACGAVVRGGTVLKLMSAKIDFHDTESGPDVLVARARLTAEDAQREVADTELRVKEDKKARRRAKDAKKRKKLAVGENRANFSQFRNKDFASGSKPGKAKKSSGEDGAAATEEGQEEEDEDENEDEEQEQDPAAGVAPAPKNKGNGDGNEDEDEDN